MSEQKKIRGGALLARAFKQKGVEHAFTLAGGFCNPALEGFMECQMPVINCPHEQVAGHLADGHARITRKPTLCLVGPEGFANAVPAMLEAWGERSPVIFVTGSSTLKRQGSGGFKEIDDVAIAAPLTKYSAQIVDERKRQKLLRDSIFIHCQTTPEIRSRSATRNQNNNKTLLTKHKHLELYSAPILRI